MSLPIQNVGYGLTNALQGLAPEPVVSNRNPTSKDLGFEIGTIWCNKSNNNVYILSSVANGLANWASFSQSIGSSATTPLVVSAVASGTATAATASATVNARYGQVAVSAVPALTAGTGILTLTVSNSFVNTTTTSVLATASIFDHSGNHAAMAIVGTVQAAGQLIFTIVNGGAGAPGAGDIVYLNFQLPPNPAAASATTSLTLNAQSGLAIITGKLTAAAGSFAITLTNSYITTTSPLVVSVSNLNASLQNANVSVLGVIQAAGSAVINIINNGAGALGVGDNVLISFYVPQLPSTSTGTSATRTVQSVNSLSFVTGLLTAQNATITFTITDEYVLANSSLIINVTNINPSASGAFLTNGGLYQTAGGYVFFAINNGGGALVNGDNVLMTNEVLS